MKIMHLIDSGGLYGAEAMLLDLMVGQKKMGLHPLLCSIGTAGQDEKEIERQARSRELDVSAVRFRAGLNPVGAYNILRMAQTCQADILHSHGYKGNILAGIVPRFIRKIPLISTLHGWTNTSSLSKLALYEWLDRRMLRHKDAVVAVNRLMLGDVRLMSAKVPSHRLYVVNNGINPEPPWVDETGSPSRSLITNFARDGFVIGAIGRLSEEKGFNYLLEAIALLHRAGINIRLVLVGDGPLKDKLQQLAVSLGIDRIVLFIGYLANASQYLDCFDVLVISSLSEGLPITLLESMRAGIPVISTRVGGIPDVIVNDKSGILVSPGNPNELRDAIILVMKNPKITYSMIKQAKSLFNNNYSSDKMALDYLSVYKSLFSLPGD